MAAKKQRGFDRILNIALAILVFFGYIMVISAHSVVAIKYGNGHFLFEIAKITVFIIFGIFLMFLTRKYFSIKWFLKHETKISIILTLMMLATLLFADQYGGRSWIRLPGMSVQPVELVKIYMIIVLANHFSNLYNKKVSASQIMRFPVILISVISLFVFIAQGDLGSGLITIMIFLCMFFALPESKFRFYKVVTLTVIIVLVALFYLFGPMLSDYIYSLPEDTPMRARLLRLAILFDPIKTVYGSGYQLTNALASFASSGLFGAGLGNSEIKFLIPEPYNDAIIAVIADELGLVGVFFVFALYFIIITRLIVYATNPKVTLFDKLVLVGISSFFMMQFFVNIGGMIGAIPLTGVTLLFVSSGGTSIVTAFIAIGIAQGIIKRYLK